MIDRQPDRLIWSENDIVFEPKTLGGPGSGNFGHAGRPGEIGGSSSVGRSDEDIQKQADASIAKERQRRAEVVERRAGEVANEMGVDPKIINVVDQEPRAFKVGDHEFKEAGHFDPKTGMIEINARNSYYDRMSLTNGIVAHEISHAMYDVVKKESDAEFQRYLEKAIAPSGLNHTPWYEERFTMTPTGKQIKPGFEDELAREFPASWALRPLAGGGLFTGLATEVMEENGHSAYAKSYWTKEAVQQAGYGHESAINESLAEVTRFLTQPMSWNESGEPKPNSPWVETVKNMRRVYPTLKK